MAIVKLVSADNVTFEVEYRVACLLVTVKNMLTNLENSVDELEPIPLPQVDSNILKIILEWAEHHVNDTHPEKGEAESEEDRRSKPIPEWDQKLLNVNDSIIFGLLAASNYLEVKGLLEVCCKTIAKDINGKSPEEIRKRFGIADDITEAKKDQINEENEFLAR